MKIKNSLLMLVAFALLLTSFGYVKNNVHAATASDANSSNTVYDLSEWQHNFTDSQVQQLKNEVPFVILRVQYGSQYYDKTFNHNRDLLEKYGVPYGVYSFSQYESPADAADEAKTLYRRAPNAKFYVNDYESQTVKSGGTDNATKAWVDALRPLVGQRKILFYSYVSFMQAHASSAVSNYDGYWLAAYQNQEPSREHVLWQFSSTFYSNSLGQRIDANLLTSKDANWFIGDNTSSSSQPSNNDQNNDDESENNDDSSNQDQNSNSDQPQQQTRNTQYTQQNKTMTVKNGYNYKFFNHVPGDNKFIGKTYAISSVSSNVRKRVYINSIATVNGRTYYRMYANGRAMGWVNTNALVPNVKYYNYSTTKVMKSNPKVAFHNHVNNSGFASTVTTANGTDYANKKMTITRRAKKDGWKSYYYQTYYRGKLIGWIYQSAFK